VAFSFIIALSGYRAVPVQSQLLALDKGVLFMLSLPTQMVA
jgi:hypothetical protein